MKITLHDNVCNGPYFLGIRCSLLQHSRHIFWAADEFSLQPGLIRRGGAAGEMHARRLCQDPKVGTRGNNMIGGHVEKEADKWCRIDGAW